MPRTTPTPKQPPASAREVLAINMIRLRAERGWSQEQLAWEAGLHRTFIAHVERQARNISLDNIELIATALELRVYQLLTPIKKRSLLSDVIHARSGGQGALRSGIKGETRP